jgi:outer membrane protein OmpA-like peptidoglycan-associated protein
MIWNIDLRAIHRRDGRWRFLALWAGLVFLPLGLGACSTMSNIFEFSDGDDTTTETSDRATGDVTEPAQSSNIADLEENPESPVLQALSGTYSEAAPQPSRPAASNEITNEAEEALIAVLPAAGPPLVQARILFPEASVELSGPAKVELIRVAKMLTQDQTMRVQLLAFAQGSDSGTGSAGRISLTRAFVVRAFLLDQGVQPVRVNLRSLADQVQNGPPDRVDVLLGSPSG